MTVKKYLKESIKVGDRDLTVEIGRVAKQADGSCVIRYGDTMVLCAAVGARGRRLRQSGGLCLHRVHQRRPADGFAPAGREPLLSIHHI